MQDVTQEAFCRALDRWARVSTYTHAQMWVRQVAWNLATSRLRHLQVAKRYLARQRIEHVDGPSPDRIAMVEALAKLPPKHRLAVVLHHVGRLSTAEIARQEGVAEGTVRSWLSRGRAKLAEHFEESLTEGAAGIRPPGVEAAAKTVRRRRTARRATLAAVLALVIAIPLAILLRGKGGEPPIIGPTVPPPSSSPSPTPSPSPVAAKRTISVPGVTFAEQPDVQFVDGQHGWLLQERTLASTSDGGVTWKRVSLPDIPGNVRLVMYVLNTHTLTLRVTEDTADTPREFRLTRDGGATWSTHPWSNPPAETRLVGGRYQLLCPGAHGQEDGANGVSCDRPELVKVGAGRVSPQPPWREFSTVVQEGADGRVWLTDRGATLRVAVSSDQAKTWRETPQTPAGAAGLRLSQDGKRAWVWSGDGTIWELTGDGWKVATKVPGGVEGDQVWPIGEDVWLARHERQFVMLVGDRLIPVPLSHPNWAAVLRDGTIYISGDGGFVLGYGTGQSRTWAFVGL